MIIVVRVTVTFTPIARRHRTSSTLLREWKGQSMPQGFLGSLYSPRRWTQDLNQARTQTPTASETQCTQITAEEEKEGDQHSRLALHVEITAHPCQS